MLLCCHKRKWAHVALQSDKHVCFLFAAVLIHVALIVLAFCRWQHIMQCSKLRSLLWLERQ